MHGDPSSFSQFKFDHNGNDSQQTQVFATVNCGKGLGSNFLHSADRPKQDASGHGIAQADHGGIAVVNFYESTKPHRMQASNLLAAASKLAELPVNELPDVGALPAGSRMSFSRNPMFVGRTGDLLSLAGTLKKSDTTAVGQIVALTGLGGIGKTQLACEFVHRYGQYFSGGVYWLSFTKPESIPSEIAACGGVDHLDLRPDYSALPIGDQVKLVASALQSALPRLLVFDNCEDETLLEQWRPLAGGARVLVTSQRDTWDAALGVTSLALDTLAQEESVSLLRKHRSDLTEDDADLVAIASELGDLPLALHLAGCFLHRYRHAEFAQPVDYLAQLQEPNLLAHPSLTVGGYNPTGHEQHVGRTFAISYDRLDAEDGIDELVYEVLARCACFAAGKPIPRKLLRMTLNLPADDPTTGLRYEDALRRASEIGLLDEDDEGALVLHRLVAAFLERVSNDLQGAREAVENVVAGHVSLLNKEGLPAPLLPLQPHLRHIAECAELLGSERAGTLLNELGYHLRIISEFDGARAAYERALRIDEITYGPDHPEVATDLNNLGLVLWDQGDLKRAQEVLERALRIREAALGSDHPDVAIDLNSLGLVLRDQRDFDGARTVYKRALAIRKATHGPNHPGVATVVSNMGLVLLDLGDLSDARAAFEEALQIDERAYGPNHPKVAIRINNLGVVLRDQGDLDGARTAFKQALGIDEATYGQDHRDVAIFVYNMGTVLWKQGDFEGARAAFERALFTFERRLGPNHTRTQNVKQYLEAIPDD